MSDIKPKAERYILISIFIMLLNIGGWVFSISSDITGSLLTFATGIGTAFLPFVSLISLAFLGLPEIVIIIVGVFITIFSGVQAFFLAMMILQIIHNVIYNPDV